MVTDHVTMGSNAYASIFLSVCLFLLKLFNWVTFDFDLLQVYGSWPYIALVGLKVKAKVRVSVWNVVGGTLVLDQGQFLSWNQCFDFTFPLAWWHNFAYGLKKTLPFIPKDSFRKKWKKNQMELAELSQFHLQDGR